MPRLQPSERIGQILNNRKIIEVIKVNGINKYVWECCLCGSVTKGEYANLKKEKKDHCGCLGGLRAGSQNPSYKHGKTRSSEWNSWASMKQRLFQKSNKSFYYYTEILKLDVDPRWIESFEAFYSDMGEKPSPEYTLERINMYEGYWPDNCRWATRNEQAKNKTNILWCEYNSTKYPLRTLCALLDLKYNTVYMRIRRGHADPFFGVKDAKFLGTIV